MGKEVNVELVQVDGLTILGKADSGHWIVMDAAPDVGGNDAGIRPFETFLVSLAGCTGMDVIAILSKMRVPFKRLRVKLHAVRKDTHPKIPERVEMTYIIEGDPEKISPENVEKAIKLSQDKYCSVSAVVKKAGIPVEWDYKIVESN